MTRIPMTLSATPTRRRATMLGASTLLATGLLHALTIVVGAPVSAEEARAREVMAATHLVIAGTDRSLWQLFLGFSIAMAIFIVGVGALNVLALKRDPGIFLTSNAALALNLAISLGALAVAVLLLPAPPIVLFTLAAGAFAIALARPTAPTAKDNQPTWTDAEGSAASQSVVTS